MSPLRYGLKLSDDWTSSRRWRDLCGQADQFAAFLARCGVDFVEISTGEGRIPAQLLQAANPLVEAGLAISVHPYVEQRMALEIFTPEGAGDPWAGLLEVWRIF